MKISNQPSAPATGLNQFAALFTPKLVTILREGYGWQQFRTDAIAGMTVAVVALPLSMAIAIGSGLTPEKGLFTAVVAGFLISALGGSRFQIGGPAGAFIVLVGTIVERHGYNGLVLATMMSGGMMVGIGLLRAGAWIRYIPYPVIVGFTAGIASIIFASQLRELLGLEMAAEPAALVPKLEALAAALGTARPAAIVLAAASIAIIVVMRRLRPNWPGMLVAIVLASLLAWTMHLDVATIGSRFGPLPRTLPSPSLPTFDLAAIRAVFPDAVAIAVLGAIESLLSAVVADGMTGRQHRSNCELVAQGVANIASVSFGGMCATGTIARTATNVRAGAYGPVSGMMHALYILMFMLVAAPLAAFIPLAALAAVLAVVAWNMIERRDFVLLLRSSRGDLAVLLATFLLTVLVDLPTAIVTGVSLGAFLVLYRLAQAVEVETGHPVQVRDEPDASSQDRAPYDPALAVSEVVVHRIKGAFFFASATAIAAALSRSNRLPSLVILDFSAVPVADSTAAKALEGIVHRLHATGAKVIFTGSSPAVRHTLWGAGLREPEIRYLPTLEEAIASDPASTNSAKQG